MCYRINMLNQNKVQFVTKYSFVDHSIIKDYKVKFNHPQFKARISCIQNDLMKYFPKVMVH